jgi:Putative MetA-pathway of phenol degradation
MRPAMRAPRLLLILLLMASPPTALANDNEIEPDRPDVSTSARPVGRCVIQLETGLDYARTSLAGSAAERRFAVQGTLRIGLTDALEARLEGEPLVRLRSSEEETDIGDLFIGLKYRLFEPPKDSWWPTLGLLPTVKLPTGQPPIGSGEPDGALIGLASFALPAEFDLDVNAGIAARGQPNGVLLQALISASLGYSFTTRLRGLFEFFFATREQRDSTDGAGIQTGLLYLITPALALDAAVRTSVIGRAPDYGLRAGVSVRFGR